MGPMGTPVLCRHCNIGGPIRGADVSGEGDSVTEHCVALARCPAAHHPPSDKGLPHGMPRGGEGFGESPPAGALYYAVNNK